MNETNKIAESLLDQSYSPDFAKRFRSNDSSVRTTFTLSQEAVDTLDWLADHTGKTRKDMIGEVLELCRTAWQNQRDELDEAVKALAVENPVRKSMAISASTRSALNKLSEEAGISRDNLMELGIQLARLVAEETIEKQIKPHKKIVGDLKELLDRTEAIRSTLRDQARSDDPVDRALFGIVRTLEEMIADVETEIRTSKPLEQGHQFL